MNRLSNLPPGVTENMIPGNRPEDIEEEAFLNAFEVAAEADNIAIPNSALDSEWFNQSILLAKEMGYKDGYTDGKDDERQSSD